MTKRNLLRPLSVVLTAGLVVTSISVPASASSSSTQSALSELNTISRVEDSNENGLIHYSYVDEDGNNYDLDTSSDSAAPQTSTSTTKKATKIPSSYDLRDYSRTTAIRDQGVTGSCWAFGAIKALESNLITKNLYTSDTADFSENHLAWFTYHLPSDTTDALYGDGFSINQSSNSLTDIWTPSFPFGSSTTTSSDVSAYDYGGSALTAMFTLASWKGAELESNAPFTADTTDEESTMADTMTNSGEALRYDSSAHLQNAECYDNASRTNIKKALMTNGALDVAMYYDESGFETGNSYGSSYYQTQYSGSAAVYAANHCVTIVGWDDNYSKSNFASAPSSNGAWLIANSYGTSYNDNGYFWMSYEEPSINEIYTMDTESTDNYDTSYQYDGNGWGDAVYVSQSNVAGSNVYTADDTDQSLKAVSFYTVTDNQKYTIRVYKDLTGTDPSTGTLVDICTTSGTATYAGYHTVDLAAICNITAGTKFAVSVTYQYDSSTGNEAYLPIEGESYNSSDLTASYSSSTGQSFVCLNNTWYDTSTQYNNLCIKAFTTDGVTETTSTVKMSKSSLTLGKGETSTISSTLSNAADGITVSYKSSNTSVATVNASTGKIKATGKGTATITAVSTDGAYATLKLTVKKAPSKITASPSRKVIRRGRSFKIRKRITSGSICHTYTFKSSRPKIARVSKTGTVKGLRRGTTTITVKTYNGKKARVRVTVR